jgi:hypothetical protein
MTAAAEDYGATVGLPLVAFLALLGLATCAFLLWAARLSRGQVQRQPSTTPRENAVFGSRWSPWVLIVTVVFLAANHLLVRGVAIGRWDADGQFYPYYVLVADHARAASLVQWDPWSNGGMPSLGDPQVGAFSPVNVLLGVITGGTSQGFRIYWLLSWWVGGFGMLMLGRHLRAPPWGAGVVALGFLFCGVYTGNAEHTSWITAFSFLPVIIWRLDVALGSRKLQPGAEAGAVWGLSALAGYPGVVVITGCFAAWWALGRWLEARFGREYGGRTSAPAPATTSLTPGFVLASLVLVLLVGLLVLSPTYVAFFLEGAGINPRVGALARDVALSNSLAPGALATFASPYLAALKVARQFMGPGVPPGELWPATDLSMVSVYTGAIVPTLALFALLGRPRDGWRWWVAGLGLLSIACAMGEALPLRGWLYDWLYPTRFFRHAAIFRLYYVFALCVLALIATRDLADELRRPAISAPLRLPIAALLAAALAVFAFVPFVDPAWNAGMPGEAVLLGRVHFVWIWVGICAVAFLGWRVSPASRQWRVPVLLVALAASDALLTSVLSIPTMLRIGEAAERWKDLDERHTSSRDLTGNGWWRGDSSCDPAPASERCRRNDQLITKVPVLDAYATEKNAFHMGMIHHPVLKGMSTGPERIWFSREVARGPATEEAFAAFRRRAERLGAPPLVIHSTDELLARRGQEDAISSPDAPGARAIARLPAAHRTRAEIRRYLPGELVFDVDPPADGWLLVTDRWARGWDAEVNGRRTTLYGGNFIFRAIRVSAGPNRVRFTYHPAGFPWLVVASWGTLAAIGLRAVMSARSRP